MIQDLSIKDYLSELINEKQFLSQNIKDYSLDITSLSDNSKTAKFFSLFFCKGNLFKFEYLEDALNNGASYYITDRVDLFVRPNGILVKNIKIAMSIISAKFYKHKYKNLKIIGITGTKGKTSTLYMLSNILKTANKKFGYISSIENFDGKNTEVSKLSTPEPLQLHEILYKMYLNGCEYCIMEVSSQALKYDRVYGINFYISCFTNIGEDHISDIEHSSFEDYFNSKLKILKNSKLSIVNSDLNINREYCNLIYFGFKNINKNIKYELDIINSHIFENVFSVNENIYNLSIFGEFNILNATAAISIAKELYIDEKYIKKSFKEVVIPGRVEFFYNNEKNKIIIVDYAHNKLSFEVLFKSVKDNFKDYKIISIFGCPGGKAITRRKDLPEIAEKYSDYIYITEEDYGNEPLEKICSEILCNIKNKNIVEIEFDRELAVKKSIAKFEKAIVLLLGKGRETTQKRKDKYISVISDVEIAKEILNR